MPDINVYTIALEKAGCKPSECIFVDDKEYILAPAASLGINVIHAVSPIQISLDDETVIARLAE